MRYLRIPFFMSLVLLSSCNKEKQSNKAGNRMQDFVISISQYAKAHKPNFIIIPQNGPDLAYRDMDTINGIYTDYLDAIDCIAVEELFYNNTLIQDPYRLNMIKPLVTYKPVFVADYLGNDNDLQNAINLNEAEGFRCFPRINSNYYYTQIPNFILHENSNNITSLNQAQNYLYLLNSENFSSKEAYLQALAATNYDVIIMDLFYNDQELTAQELEPLKTKANGGQRLLISYINIGAAEKYRYYWKIGWTLHIPHWLAKKYDGYADEYYVKFWVKEWQDIIYGNDSSYMKKILNAGFDGAFLDNVEAYYALYYNN